MPTRIGLAAALVLVFAALMVVTSSVGAQNTSSDTITREEFERRLNELNQKYQKDLAERDRAIAELKAQLATRPATSQATSQATQLDIDRDKARQESLQHMLADIDQQRAAPTTQRTAVSFNPDFAVVSDFLGTWSDDRSNNALNRFDVREVELDLRAAVDPRADAVAIIAFPRDVANDLFSGGEVPTGPDTSVDVEEAYLFLHDFGIPNLTAKLGRFHVRFGRENILHLHDLPTSDPSFVNQAFLGPEALSDSGLSLSYVIPNPWNQYFEVVTEILAGEGAGSESPTLAGDLSVDSPAILVHPLWNVDFAKDWNFELGGSWLHGHSGPDNDLDVDLFGGDATLIHTDPSGNFNNQLFQAEFMHGLVDQISGATDRSWGAYLLAQQQVNKDWYFGARLDWTENPNDPNQEVWGVAPYVSWYWSEFLRFRIEFEHKDGDVPEENIVFFQCTWIFGAHPPHPYWAMR